MEDKGVFSGSPGVTFKRSLPAPIESVWAHLTNPSLIPAWYGENGLIEPREGGTVRLMGGHIRGVVTRWQPPIRLAYSWNVFDPAAPPDAVSAFPESYPTFKLEAEGSETLLTFRHFPVLDAFVAQNAMGWHTMLDLLAASLRGQKSLERSVFMQRNALLYGVDLEKLAR